MSDNVETPVAAEIIQEAPQRAGEASGQSENDVVLVRAHSPILYWWPVWLSAGIFWLCHAVLLADGAPSSGMGLAFVAILIFVVFSTTVRLRGANSIIFLLVVIIAGILIVMANLSSLLAGLISGLDITMSSGFYLTIFISILGLWSLMFFVFDRVRYWEVVPGQVKEHVVWGGRDSTLGNTELKCQYKSDDFLRHRILGLFLMGDLEIVGVDARVELNNVFFAKRKSRRINELIVTRKVI